MESKGTFNTAGSSVDMTRSDEESMVDGPLISADALHSAIRREFHTVPTAWHAALLSLLHVVFVVLSVCVAALCVLKLGREDVCTSVLGPVQGDSVVVFGKVGLWLLVLLFTWCVQHHHSRARCRGYLRFYRQTQGLKHLPLTVHSAGNVMLLVVMAARLSPTVHAYMLLSILALELLVALPCLLYYTVIVMRFNADRATPDVSQEEHSHNFSVSSLPTETGFRDISSLEEVVEKQADLIEYLKQHNRSLSRRLLNLSAQH
ncbi:transmembrane protein 192 isoform X2 [Dunckerocampus dactyliophorus]|uniref:transmembrane protein 192 isoform X2 n=1 Tax=Dunckerocampus dactyliophorus TaxID=161453 RepID=UPI0024056483|nr:transmembrane protein 192 isoform X2 [Dunckerocampus dactyliophorus]